LIAPFPAAQAISWNLVCGHRPLAEPGLAHRFTYKRPDPGRIPTPPHAHEVHLSPKLGFDDRQTHHARVFDCVRRHECESQPGGDHCQGPVIALAPISRRAGNSLLLENLVGVTGEFAVHAMDIALVVHLPNWECPPLQILTRRLKDAMRRTKAASVFLTSLRPKGCRAGTPSYCRIPGPTGRTFALVRLG
jgi:hypothetical protein